MIFLLGSVLAGATLVGGTFAAWAVTDNADPFSVRITPGTLDVGGDRSVTLEWGSKGLIDIQELGMGEEKGPYEVGLKATTSDASAFTGSLSVSMSTTAVGEQKLISYLHVNVYGAADKTGGAILTVPDGEHNYTIAQDIAVTSGTVKNVYFFISLDGGLSPVLYNAIKNDVVTLEIDWNKGSGIEEITSRTYFFNNTGAWSNVFAYAWNSTSGATNAEWPGVRMNQAKDAIYSVALGTGFDKVIFTDNAGHQTEDLTLGAAATPYYNDGSWVAAPDLTAETEYYLVGTMNEWTTGSAWKLSADDSKEGYTFSIKNVELPANTELKIVGSDNVWYGEHGHTGSEGNFEIGLADHYDFYFNPNGNSGTFIFCEQHA